MIHLSRLTWPFPFLVRLGWATCRTPNPHSATAPAHVFFLRGQAILFSGGFGTLCDALRRRGVWAEDLRCIGDLWARRWLVAEKRAGRWHGPIVFVGHSCGGRYALYAAQALQRLGVAVDLVVGLDVAFPPVVPGNVKRAINLHRGGWRIYPAGRFQAEPGAATLIENIDLCAEDSPVPARWLHHLNFTNSAAMQEYVLRRVLETVAESQNLVE